MNPTDERDTACVAAWEANESQQSHSSVHPLFHRGFNAGWSAALATGEPAHCLTPDFSDLDCVTEYCDRASRCFRFHNDTIAVDLAGASKVGAAAAPTETEHFEIRYWGYNGESEDCWGAWEECSEEDYLSHDSRRVNIQIRKWTEPATPPEIPESGLAPSGNQTDALREALADAIVQLEGWISWKCPPKHRAEHEANVERLRAVLTASPARLGKDAIKAAVLDSIDWERARAALARPTDSTEEPNEGFECIVNLTDAGREKP